jgi:hypothetical protein
MAPNNIRYEQINIIGDASGQNMAAVIYGLAFFQCFPFSHLYQCLACCNPSEQEQIYIKENYYFYQYVLQ